jgi:hypothetical protein
MERVQLLTGQFPDLVAASVSECLVERRLVAQDVVLEASSENAQSAEFANRRGSRLERVARATSFTKRLCKDFGHGPRLHG